MISFYSPISGAYAATQVVVFEELAGENMSRGLAKIAVDSFKSRLNQMNFMVLETNSVSRKVGLNSITPQRPEVLSSLSKIYIISPR